ncbi:hypothetical protein [Roseovarius amoyensis]|uniref:hypothetical protein n=1 Tax=Roseovarius amoyensis TaxID=2211448 RepID=UPI000DBE590A|nr:hypothetical protein [Roseovarius amoyensis]
MPNRLPRRLSKPGPVIDYILHLYQADRISPGKGLKEKADQAVAAVQAVAATEHGAMLLELLEKSTQEFFLPPDADACALDALNSQRFIALDLRRIASDEIRTELDRHSEGHSGARRGRRG